MLTTKTTTLKREFVWPDRRPIGILHLSDTGFVSQMNPCGWLFDQSRGLKNGVQDYVTRALGVLKKINAQGFVVWDLEGMAYPKASYLGAPDRVRELNRDMPYDEFFYSFRAAGLEPGVLVRCDEEHFDSEANTWVNVVSPDPFQTLLRKSAYARKRWKCKLFYVDTNMYDWRTTGELLPATTFERLHKALPDCLWIPEHMKEPGRDGIDYSYYQHSAPYMELRNKDTGTASRVLENVVDAFSVLNVTGVMGKIPENTIPLRTRLKRGDILMVDAWWDNPCIDEVVELMRGISV